MIRKHSEASLSIIKYWSIRYPIELIETVVSMFDKPDQVERAWYKDEDSGEYFLDVVMKASGSFGNEQVINALLANSDFKKACYLKWERGGIYTFRIFPHLFNYIKVSQFVIDNRMARQQVYKNEKLYEWVKVSENIRLIRRRF